MTITHQCARRAPNGPACDRRAEATVHLMSAATGVTTRREQVCPVHAFASLEYVFVDVCRPGRELMTVVVSPL